MIRHTLTLLWNTRKRYIGIFSEQMLVFIILTLCMVSLIKAYRAYKDPGLLDTNNVICFGYMQRMDRPVNNQQIIESSQKLDVIIKKLKALPYVEAISESIQFIPYLRPKENYLKDSINIFGKKIGVNIKLAEAEAQKVFHIELDQGSWFTNTEFNDDKLPAVITRQLAIDNQWHNPIGKVFSFGSQEYRIIGIIPGIKESAFQKSEPTVILPIKNHYNSFYREFCARIKPGNEESFFNDYTREFRKQINLNIQEPIIFNLTSRKQNTMTFTITLLLFQTIPTVFLVLFAFIGTFSLFVLHAQKRISEYALKLALGSTRKQLMIEVITEGITICLLSIIPGVILVLSIYSLTWLHVLAIIFTMAIMLLFSIISAWYPAHRVTKINPAEALHNE